MKKNIKKQLELLEKKVRELEVFQRVNAKTIHNVWEITKAHAEQLGEIDRAKKIAYNASLILIVLLTIASFITLIMTLNPSYGFLTLVLLILSIALAMYVPMRYYA
jgi:uncharacterized membrane-anchored protein